MLLLFTSLGDKGRVRVRIKARVSVRVRTWVELWCFPVRAR